MLLALSIALAIALTGVLWFAWPFLRIRAREAWHRRRGEKGPKFSISRAERDAGGKLLVPYGYQAVNRRRRRKKAIRKTYQLSGKQMTKLERAVRANQQVTIVKENGRGRVVAGPPMPLRAVANA